MTVSTEAVATLTGRAVASVRASGSVARVRFDDCGVGHGGVGHGGVGHGGDAVAKSGDVTAEAAGLRWLAAPGAVGVPAVLGASTRLLVTEAVPEGPATREAAATFGRGLAALHAAGAPAFGSPPPGGPVEAWIGGAPMRNVEGDAWPEWYAEHRVLTYAREAFTGADLAVVERLCTRLPALAGPAEPPARLHGDLWTGNVLWSDRGAYVIDPAAHGGHRETDLAMLALFGCPHLEVILAAYDAAAPLAPGWRDRVALHQLWPLLVHTVLFGGAYAGQARRACERSLRL